MSTGKDKLREEYPPELIKSGVRGKYAKRFQEGTNLVLVDADLRAHFPDSKSVNRALRECLKHRMLSVSDQQGPPS